MAGCAASDPSTVVQFRIPCPPAWDERGIGAWAGERRARKAYFATLDALATGAVDAQHAAKLANLIREARSPVVRGALQHFERVLAFTRRSRGRPVIPPPAEPLESVVITVPVVPGETSAERLRARYDWTLEWLRMRRYVVSKGLALDWRVLPTPSARTPHTPHHPVLAVR